MKYCSRCGSAVTRKIPAGDNRERDVCTACEAIHYVNPRVVVGCLVTYGDKVLLAKRAIDPRAGYWTLPAGFLENGETLAHGAARETLEEVKAEVQAEALYTVFSLPHISQIYTFFRAELAEPKFGVGEETLAVDLFEEDDVPWDELAFPVIRDTLKFYFEDRRTGEFPTRSRDIIVDPSRRRLR